jgi:hypothetical protein
MDIAKAYSVQIFCDGKDIVIIGIGDKTNEFEILSITKKIKISCARNCCCLFYLT